MNLRSGYPFWLIKNGLPYNYPKLTSNIKARVVILGGGISGALTSYYLTQAGIECVLLDARTIGLGSTCASTSLLQYEIDTPLSKLKHLVGQQQAVRSYELCKEAIGEIGAISKKLNFPAFRPKKSLFYAAWKKDVQFLNNELKERLDAGFKVRLLDKTDIAGDYGFDAPAAILSECGAEMDAYLFTHFLLQHCIKKGLQVFDRTEVCEIKHSTGEVKLITTSGHRVTCKKLVYATGYESVRYIKDNILDLNSTYAVISDQSEREGPFWKDEAMIWSTADPYLYIRTTSDNRILVGGRDETFSNPVRRDKLLEKKKRMLVNDFQRLFPHLEFNPEFSWCGTFGATRDGLPYIGNYRGLPNSYFALGFGGNGITFSLIAARIICDLINGKINADEKIFSFDR